MNAKVISLMSTKGTKGMPMKINTPKSDRAFLIGDILCPLNAGQSDVSSALNGKLYVLSNE